MVRITGTAGSLRVGYQRAADLGAWELELLPVLPRAYRLSAQIRTVSDYWLGQTPLALVLEVGGQQWRWPDVTPQLSGAWDRMTCALRQAPVVTETGAGRRPAKETIWERSGR